MSAHLYRLHLLELQQFVDIAWDENSALELASMRAYDFILVDGNSNYSELVAHVQKNSVFNEHTPIIVLSSNSNEYRNAHLAPIFFKKPISKEDAKQLIEFLKNLKNEQVK